MATPRIAHVNLTDPTFDAFVAFAKTAYPDQPITAALREAALVLMGTDPMEAAKAAARRAAWLIARAQVSKGFGTAFRIAVDTFQAAQTASIDELRQMIANGEIPDPNQERAA